MKLARQLGIYLLAGALVAALLLAWIGLVYAVNIYSTAKVSADAIVNMMLTGLGSGRSVARPQQASCAPVRRCR
ncbi:hypothetical protein MNO14_00060 [Luteimonas sp. S4-F44]|uniref:hypothetical protein n=1 Tax=Luteimonas sp. S4-F44 TaxID=2925842 RepID=UPI001F530366|nr:hypothetical protein [Luteimonas sp. S4-F44]UNK42540.1 hypothetical protein MNO14_00060 [Luteimonas sp. S4-F44]